MRLKAQHIKYPLNTDFCAQDSKPSHGLHSMHEVDKLSSFLIALQVTANW